MYIFKVKFTFVISWPLPSVVILLRWFSSKIVSDDLPLYSR